MLNFNFLVLAIILIKAEVLNQEILFMIFFFCITIVFGFIFIISVNFNFFRIFELTLTY